MGIGVLGPVVVEGSGPVSPRDRVLLSALVVRRGEVVSADQLADALWGEHPPDSWRKVVQGGVARLRKMLGSAAIETLAGGYRLLAADDDVDSWRFEALVARAAALTELGEHDRASDVLQRAQSLWRGEPLADLSGWSAGQAEAGRLLELRRMAEERQVSARLALGEHRDVVGRVAALAEAEPLREERWTLLATALYRSGRQAEALRCLHDARRVLGEQLGVAPGADLVALEQAILDQDPALAPPLHPRMGTRAECPYLGLEAYDEAHSDEFFGRESETEECRARLAANGFVAVVGPSGSGKSSLVRAGLVPGLRREGRHVVVMVPGSDPGATLTVALAATRPDTVLVVDQGEELFTVCSEPGRRQGFATALAKQAAIRPVIVTLRADHVGDLVAHPVLSRLVEGGLYLLGPMGETDLRAAIEGPARDAGLRLEAGLVDLLVRDVVGQPGALPLLSHALVETWARREGRVLTVAAYRETGGVHGAVARTAEQLYESLSDPQRHDARALFLRLVSVERDGQAVRHRVSSSMLAGDQDEIARTLVRARLLTAGEGSLEIAHEALADAWPRLQHWLEEDRDGQRILTDLGAAAQDWSAHGADAADLYRGHRLENVHEWVERAGFELSPIEQRFLTASVDATAAAAADLEARHRQQISTNRRLTRQLRAVAALLVVALVAGGIAFAQVGRADHERNRAQAASKASALERVVSESLDLRGTRRDLSALLAAEAYRLHPSPETENALFSQITVAPDFAGYLRAGAAGLWTGALAPGAHRLVVADTKSVVRIFDLDRMDLLRTIRPTSAAQGYGVVATTPDAGTVLIASGTGKNFDGGGVLSAYDTRSGRQRFSAVGLDFAPGDLAVSPDGRSVAVSGGPSGDIDVRDVRTGVRISRIPPAPPGIGPNEVSTAPVAFLTSRELAIGSEVGLIRIVDPTTGAVLRSMPGPSGYAENRLFPSPDGRELVTSGVQGTIVRDLATGAIRGPGPRGVTCNRVAPDFRLGLILCVDPFGRVRAFDLATGAEAPQRFDFQHGFVSSVAVSTDGRTVAFMGGADGVVGLWRLDGSGPLQHSFGSGTDAAVGYSQVGGRALLVADSSAARPQLRVVDPTSGRTVDRLAGAVNATWSTARDDVATLSPNGTAAVVDVVNGRHTARGAVALPFVPEVAVVDPPRHRVVILDHSGHVRGVRAGHLVAPTLDLPGGVRDLSSAAITPNGRDLLVASAQRGTEVYDLRSGRRIAARRDLIQVAVSSQNVAAVGARDGHVELADPRTLRARGALPAAPGAATSVHFSADGRRLLVGAGDGTLHLMDVRSRSAIGDPISVATRDSSAASAQQLLRADGAQLAVDLDDGIGTWSLAPTAWARAACAIAGRNLTRDEWRQHLAVLGPYHRTCLDAS